MEWGVGERTYGWVDAGEAWFALGRGGGRRSDGDGARLLLLGGAWGGARGGGCRPRRCWGGHCGCRLSRARRVVLLMFFVDVVRTPDVDDVDSTRFVGGRWQTSRASGIPVGGAGGRSFRMPAGNRRLSKGCAFRGNGSNPSSRRGTQLGKNKDVNWERKKDKRKANLQWDNLLAEEGESKNEKKTFRHVLIPPPHRQPQNDI